MSNSTIDSLARISSTIGLSDRGLILHHLVRPADSPVLVQHPVVQPAVLHGCEDVPGQHTVIEKCEEAMQVRQLHGLRVAIA